MRLSSGFSTNSLMPQTRQGKSALILTDLDGTTHPGNMQDTYIKEVIAPKFGLEGEHVNAVWKELDAYMRSKGKLPNNYHPIRSFLELIRELGFNHTQKFEEWLPHIKPYAGLRVSDLDNDNGFYQHIQNALKKRGAFDQVKTGFITLGHAEVGEQLPFARHMNYKMGSKFKACPEKNILGIAHAMTPEYKGLAVKKLRKQMKDADTTVVAIGDSPFGGDKFMFENADLRIGVYDPLNNTQSKPELMKALKKNIVDAVLPADYSIKGPVFQKIIKRLSQ